MEDRPGTTHFEDVVASLCGGSGFTGRIDSAWFTAHCGWIPAREYTAFLQTGQMGRVGIGTCQYF